MVKHTVSVLLVSVSLQTATGVWASQTNIVIHPLTSDVAAALAKAEQPSRESIGGEFGSPRSTFEKLLRCSASGDIEGFISCFTKDQQERFRGNKPGASPLPQKRATDMARAGFSDIQIQSLDCTSSEQNTKLTGVFVSTRHGRVVREKLNVELIDTNDGWKITGFHATVLPEKTDEKGK